MSSDIFLNSLEIMRSNLVNQDVKRAFNSIGSHVFFEFGKDVEVISTKGKRSFRKEWIIWISHASWRITKDEKYIVGSGENLAVNIQFSLEKLLGKRFKSFQILSQFFDMEFNFEDGYQLTTFFNCTDENQWTLFLPDQNDIGIDCSSREAIKKVKAQADNFKIKENYKYLDLPAKDVIVKNITYSKENSPVIHFENDIYINFEVCTWRLEKDNEYCIGYLDENKEEVKNKLSKIIGKKIKRVDVANSMMDARFQFEDQYVLKTFSCCRAVSQWRVYSKMGTLFHANIPIAE